METSDLSTSSPSHETPASQWGQPEEGDRPEEKPRGARRWILPLVFVLAGLGILMLLVKSRPQAEREVAPVIAPLVRVVSVTPRDQALSVQSQGTVQPSTEASLVAEVAGKVVWVSTSFAAGGFFRSGEALVRLDRRDFDLAVVRAEAEVSKSNVRLKQARAEAEVARSEWRDLGEGKEASPLVLRLPQVEEAEAVVLASEATLREAKLNLERTTIRAPYAGRVRSKQADVGQFLSPGQPVGGIYGVDFAEVRLPVPNAQLAYLDMPLAYRDSQEKEVEGPSVQLTSEFAGRTYSWSGRIVRSEGEIDPKSRLVNLVARVEDPYGRREGEQRPPLAVGLFVDAEIEGIELDGIVSLPRGALLSSADNRNQVLVLDSDSRLRFRSVEVLRRTGSEVLIANGLRAGEKVCVSAVEAPVDGMQVRTQAAASSEMALQEEVGQ